MDAPISLAERNRINAENRAKYEAKLADKAAHQAARKAELRERRLQKAGMDSCGSVEQTGNPRSGCACEKCGFRRAEKSANQRARRHGEELPKVKTEAIQSTTAGETDHLWGRQPIAYVDDTPIFFSTESGAIDAPAIVLTVPDTDCRHVARAGRPRRGCKCGTCQQWWLVSNRRAASKNTAWREAREAAYRESTAAFKRMDAAAKRAQQQLRAARLIEAECPSHCVTDQLLKDLRSGVCAYCGDPAEAADHVVALAAGGAHCRDNLVPACQPCNSAKHAMPVDEFLRRHPDLRFTRQQSWHEAVTTAGKR